MSFLNSGRVWSPAGFDTYLRTLKRPKWVRGITVHHTAVPSLQMRPQGHTAQLIENIRYGYVHDRGWSSGPHLFPDDTGHIWGMTPLTEPGTHARSFNATHIGIEVLGDYDSEDPKTGRGLNAWLTAASAVRSLQKWLGLPKTAFNFHRDDPKTTKTCPGKKVTHEWFLKLIDDAATLTHPPDPPEYVNVAKFAEGHGRTEMPRREGKDVFIGSWRLETWRYSETTGTEAIRSELERWLESVLTPRGGAVTV